MGASLKIGMLAIAVMSMTLAGPAMADCHAGDEAAATEPTQKVREMVDDGPVEREAGGTVTHAETATPSPQDNWFTNDEQEPADMQGARAANASQGGSSSSDCG